MSVMTQFLTRSDKKLKQSERLRLISLEARRIRELHEAGKITALAAARLLVELRRNPEQYLQRQEISQTHSAA